MKYLRASDANLLTKIEQEPKLLRLPLVRGGKIFSVGLDESAWATMLAQPII